MTPADFLLAPLDAQLSWLEISLSRQAAPELIARCQPLRDPTPLVWLTTRLLERRHLDDSTVRQALLQSVQQLPDTTLDRVIKGLVELALQDPSHRPTLQVLLRETLEQLPLERLPALSLLDRVLKQQFPLARDAWLHTLEQHARKWLEQPSFVCPEAWLAQLSAPAWQRLKTHAASLSASHLVRLVNAEKSLAARCLEVLAQQPRALSQANAEELLSRRVYTDPGHFLVELLQNAEDAEATHWQLTCEPQRLLVWHDGLPFDARDVVGVTSIGQTTKRRQQIGFFGVGFKSVYEVTRRPALFSGPWQFEIVDVSIPRALEQRPSGVPEHGTLLILPLAQPQDPQRSAQALFEKANALDPRVLLTLRNLRHLELKRVDPHPSSAQPRLHTRVMAREALPATPLTLDEPQLQVMTLETGQASGPQRLLRLELERPYDPLLKDPDRRQPPPEVGEAPPSTRLSLVMRLSPEGLPIPLEPHASTLYSFLPTAEKTGLRLLMQAHFEVPVDRERLAPNARFNQWLLSQLPLLLHQLCTALLTETPLDALRRSLPEAPHPPPTRVALAEALLEVLPLEEELSPLLRPLWPALKQALEPLPLLPCRNQRVEPAAQCWLLEPSLAEIPGASDPPVVMPLAERAQRLARALNTPSMTLDGLLTHFEQGKTVSQLSAPAREKLLQALLDAATSLQTRALRLPLFPDRSGNLLPAARNRTDTRGVLRVPAELEPLAAFFEDLRPLLSREASGQPADQLLERAQAPALSFELLGIELVSGSAAWQSSLPARREGLLRLLAEQTSSLSLEVLRHAANLPLFPDSRGRAGPLALPGRKRPGLDVVPSPAELVPLLELAGLRLLDPAWLEPLKPLVDALNVPRADLPLLLEQLLDLQPIKKGEARPNLQTDAVLPRLHRLLLHEKEALRTFDPPQPRAALPPASPLLSSLVIWRTQAGGVRSADQVVDATQLAEVLTDDPVLQPLLAETLLSSADRPTFEGLSPLLQPLPVCVWLDQLVRAGAREHRPLEDQPPLLSTPTRLARVLAHQLMAQPQASYLKQPLELPLLDALGRLRLDRLYFASEETVKLLEGLPLHGTLLHPILSESLGWPPPEPLRMRLSALEPGEVLEELARVSLPRHRLPQLYAWLESQLGTLLASPRALKVLRDARLFLNAAGELVTPRGLMLDPALQSLGRDWTPSPMIPSTLLSALAHPLELGIPSPQRLALALGRLVEAPEKAPLVAQLVRRLLETPGATRDEALKVLPLGSVSWLPDAHEQLRYARELFPSSADVANLVGGPEDQPGIWLHPSVENLLGPGVLSLLPLRSPEKVQVEEVLAFVTLKVSQRRAPPLRVYAWLEQVLTQGRATPEQLRAGLEGLAWIQTDEGELHPPQEVLGCSAWRYFGRRRGYWEQGMREYPRLCATFDIPREVRPLDVLRFFSQLPQWLPPGPEPQSLRIKEVSLVRQLLSGYALLGRKGEPIPLETPYLLVEPRSPELPPSPELDEGPQPEQLRLVTPFARALYRSNTPTLEALFAKVGPFWKVVQGPVDDREGLELFHQRLRIPLISEAWSLQVQVEPENERTERLSEPIEALRRVLRALLEVYPRLRARRNSLDPQGWQAEKRLRGLVRGGPIRVFEGLKALYLLPHVGQTLVHAPALYDTRSESLMLDTRALLEPMRHRSGLAMGLLPTLYDGPGADQLVDMLELLLPLEETAEMQAYLDRRHFPVASRGLEPLERLQERWVELCGLGLLDALQHRHPLLHKQNLSAWKEATFWSQCREQLTTELLEDGLEPEQRLKKTAQWVGERLMRALGLKSRGTEEERLHLTLYRVLLADDPLRVLRQLGLLTHAPELNAATWGPTLGASSMDSSEEVTGDTASDAAARSPSEPSAAAQAEDARSASPADPSFWQRMRQGGLFQKLGSLWQRAGDELSVPARGSNKPSANVEPLLPPRWSEPGQQLQPLSFVEGNAWSTPELRQELQGRPSPLQLQFQPYPLPSPWAYVIFTVGAKFSPGTQRWLEHPLDLSLFQSGEPTARRAKFEGRLAPGVGLLPMPLFSRLHGRVEVQGDADASSRFQRLPAARGLQPVEIRGTSPVLVRYEVELLEPPGFLPGAGVPLPSVLLEPSLPLTALPEPVQQWVKQTKARALSPSLRALEVRQFVVEHFCYDEKFKTRPKVQTQLQRLRAGEGNHALELLFAASGGSYAGRGICYELNVLVVELLRHLNVPSLVAHGWMLDEGQLRWPDHLFALALVPSGAQTVLMPLDAAVSRDFQRLGTRPTEQPGVQDAVPVVRRAPPLEPPPGLWTQLARVSPPTSAEDAAAQVQREELTRLQYELQVLRQAHQLLATLGSLPLPPEVGQALNEQDAVQLAERCGQLRRLLVQRLGDGARTAVLLQALRGELGQLKALTPEVQTLVAQGLLEVQTLPMYQVRVRRGPRTR